MGLEFRQLSPEDREIWNEKAREEKKRYDLGMLSCFELTLINHL